MHYISLQEITMTHLDASYRRNRDNAFIRRVELLLFYFSVIYDDSLTDAFIETVLRLLKAKTQTILFLAIEKR